jgi:hypothetical protein
MDSLRDARHPARALQQEEAMRNNKWIVLLVGLLACGLLAAGCGDDNSSDDTSSAATEATTATDDTATTEDTTSEDTTSEDTTSEDTSGETSPDDVYNACIDLIEGTPAEDAAKPSCEQARQAFEECQKQADAAGSASDQANQICQDAADKALKQLQAAGG